MKYVERIVIATFSLIAIFCFVEFVDVFFDRHSWVRLDASAWAAWVQAVGSIAAIIGAFAIAKKQAAESDRLRAKERFDAEADLCRAALIISVDATTCLIDIADKIDTTKPAPRHIGTERVEEILFSLRNLASKNLTFAIFNQVLAMQCEIAYTLTAIRQHNDGTIVTEERHRKARVRMKKVADVSIALYDLAKTLYRLPEVMLPTGSGSSQMP